MWIARESCDRALVLFRERWSERDPRPMQRGDVDSQRWYVLIVATPPIGSGRQPCWVGKFQIFFKNSSSVLTRRDDSRYEAVRFFQAQNGALLSSEVFGPHAKMAQRVIVRFGFPQHFPHRPISELRVVSQRSTPAPE